MRWQLWLALALSGACSDRQDHRRQTVESGRARSEARVDPSCVVNAPSVCNEDGWCAENPRTGINSLRAVWGSGPKDVFAVGDQGTILHYDGSAWTRQPAPSSRLLTDVWGAGPNDVYATGRGGTIHYDGRGWAPVKVPLWRPLCVWASSATDVWIGGQQSVHFDGTDWAAVPLDEQIEAIWGSGPRDVFAVGQRAIHHFDGKDWTLAHRVEEKRLFAIGGSGPGHVLVGWGSDQLLRYDGKAWLAEDLPNGSILEGLWASDRRVFASGLRLFGHDGERWSVQTVPGVDPSLSFTDVWGTGASDVFAVGTDGLIAHFDGAAWSLHGTERPRLQSEQLQDVWGLRPDDLHIAGTQHLLHWDGCAFRVAATASANALWGAARDDVLAVGARGGIWRWDGESWKAEASGQTADLHAVWGASPQDVYAVGDQGVAVHFDGVAWSPLAQLDSRERFTSIAGRAGRVLATTASDRLYGWEQGAWRELPRMFDASARRVAQIGEHVYVITATGSLYRSEGSTFQSIAGPFAGDEPRLAGSAQHLYQANALGEVRHLQAPPAGSQAGWAVRSETLGVERRVGGVWVGRGQVLVVGEGGLVLRKELP